MKRVLVDQSSSAEIMYLASYEVKSEDLASYEVKPEDLASYDSPLVGFNGKTVIPRG